MDPVADNAAVTVPSSRMWGPWVQVAWVSVPTGGQLHSRVGGVRRDVSRHSSTRSFVSSPPL